MPFRFKIETGVRLDADTYGLLKGARAYGLHGDVEFVHAKGPAKFEVRVNGETRTLSGTVRLHNMIRKDIEEEPERRRLWKAAHAASPVRGIDRETAPVHTAALDEDAAHRRPVFGRARP